LLPAVVAVHFKTSAKAQLWTVEAAAAAEFLLALVLRAVADRPLATFDLLVAKKFL
jgi:hypothetical protein